MPWYPATFRPTIVRDIRSVNEGVRRLRNIVDSWAVEDAELASDAPLTPFRSVRDLNGVFSALSLFAGDLLGLFSICPVKGIETFYSSDERRRRGLRVV